MRPKHPFRSLARLRITILLLCFLPVIILLHSCSPDFGVESSIDLNNEKESGPSANLNGNDLGWNLACGILTSLPQNTSGHGDAVDLEDYHASSAMSGGFALSSKLEFIKKGSSFGIGHTHLNYLNVVEDVVYQCKMPNGNNILGGLGPYIGYGLGGKFTGGGLDEPAFGGQDGYKRFDAGLSLMGRYQLPSSLYFGLDYQFGLVDKSSDPSDFTSRNRSLSFNVGYSLDKILGTFRKK